MPAKKKKKTKSTRDKSNLPEILQKSLSPQPHFPEMSAKKLSPHETSLICL